MRHKSHTAQAFAVRQLLVLAGIVLVLSASFASFMNQPKPVSAAAPTMVNFQARLENSSGSIAADGDYNVEFKLYDHSTNGATAQGVCTGNCKWVETRTSTNKVRVTNGYLTVSLGSVTAFGAISWDQELWITMNIGGTGSPTWDGEMSPRLKLTAVPYAFQAAQASKLQVLAGSNTATLQFAGSFGQNSTITLPDPGASTATVCYQGSTSCGFATTTSTNFIQNGTAVQTAANFNIRSAAIGSVGGVIQGANGQTADLLQLQSYNGTTSTNVFAVSAGGVVTLAGGQTLDVTTATAATANGLTLAPGVSSGATATGGGLTLRGGEVSGTTTVTGGQVTVQGGNASGASGSRTGGAVTIDGGTGATANGAVNIGTTNSPTINVGSVGTTSKATAINIGTTSSTTAGAIQSITIGSNSNLAHTTVIQGGSGNTAGSEAIRLVPQTTGGIAIGSTSGTGTITLGQSTAANTINIGSANFTAANTQTVNIANGSQSTAASTLNVSILSGAAGSTGTAFLYLGNNDRVQQIDIGNVVADGNRALNLFTGNTATSTTDTINIGTGNAVGSKVINIGNGTPTGTNTVTVGTTATSTSTTTIQGGTGTGAVSVQAGTSGTISLGTTNANTISIGGTNASTATTIRGGGGVNIGTGGTTGAVQIGNTTGAVTQTISIGTNATSGATNTILVGSGTTSSGTVAVNAGTGAGNTILLQSNNSSGGTVVKSATNSTAAFIIQDSGSNNYLTVDTTGTAIGIGYASSTTTLNGNVKVATLGTATVNSGLICRDSSTNSLTACNVTLSGNAFVQGGNAFGATGVLGTTDTNNLQFQTNSVVRATFDQSNNLYLGNGTTAATPNNFTVAGTGSATAGTAGALLTVAGGAGATTTTGSVGGGLALAGGNAGGTGNNNGGNVTVQGGTATGTGTAGQILLNSLTQLGTLGTTDTATYLCRNSANQFAACSTNTAGSAFVQGGNAFATTGTLGTTDNNALQVRTNNIVRATFGTSNDLALGNGTVNATPNNFTLMGTGSSTAGTNGAQFNIQAGAGATATTGSNGGVLNLSGGNANGTGNNNGGSVLIQGGANSASGARGSVILQSGGGNVGIGVTPATGNKLDVAGDINITTGSSYKINGVSINTGATLSNVAYLDQNNTFTGFNTFSRNGTATANDYSLGVTGAPGAGATSSLFRVGGAIAGGNAVANGGTYIGINAPGTGAGSAADFFNFQANGATRLQLSNSGTLTLGGTPVITSGTGLGLDITANAASTWSTSSGNLVIQAATGSNLNLGNGGGTGINIGTNNAAHQITIGNQSTAGIQAIIMGSSGNTGNTVAIEGGTAANGIQIGNGATAHGIQIGTGGAVQTVAIGSTNTTSTTAIAGGNGSTGVGAVTLQAASGGLITVGTTNSNAVTIGGATSVVSVGALGAATATAATVCRDTANGNLIACDANATGRPFLQGGNTFGATAVLGTNDANNLTLQTNGVVRATFDQSNGLYLGLGVTNAAPNASTIASTGSTTAGTAGAALTVQGGAGATSTTGSAGGGLNLNGGNAGGSGNNAGGNVTLGGGNGTGSGAKGGVVVKNAADSANAFRVQNAAGTATVLGVDTTNSYVGVGTAAAAPSRTLHVAASNTTVASQTLLVEQSGTGDSGIEVKNVAGSYYMGIDTSDSNRFKISSSTAAGTNITFGNQGINTGTAQTDAGDVNFQNASKFTSGVAGTLNSISVYISGGSSANLYAVALYTDTGGSPSRPNTLVASSANTNIIPNSWNTVAVSASINATTTYWLAFDTNDGTANMKFDTLGGTNNSCYTSRTFASAWTNPFNGSCTLGNQNFGMYANYTTASTADNLNTSLFSMGSTGDTIFRNSANSTAAFQVQKADGTSLMTADTTNTTLLLGATSGTTTLQGTVKVSSVGVVTSNVAALCRDISTTNLIACDANGTGRPFLQGGNSFATTAVLGTNDANNMQIKTNNVVRATFDQSNALYLGLGVTAAAPTGFTIAATGSSAAAVAGANLTIQGGAGSSATTGSSGGSVTVAGGNAAGTGNNGGGVVTLQGGSASASGTAGYVLVKNLANSATAFQVQDAGGSPLLTAATGQRMVMVGTTQAGTSTTTPAFLYLSDIPNNAAGNAQITGQWTSAANWGLGPNSNTADSTLRFGITTSQTNTWSTTANVNLLVAGTMRITPTGTNDSLTTFQVQRATGNGAATVFDVDTTNSRVGIGTAAPSYDLSFGGASNRVIGVETQGTTNTAGVSLTVRGATGNGTGAGGALIVQGGQGGATGQGGGLTLQSGSAGGGNNNGGTLNVTGGAGAGTGATGLVVINTPTFQTAATQSCATSCIITQANVDGNGAVVVNATAGSLNVTMNDPTITTAGRIVYVTAALGSNDFTLIVNGGGTGNQIAMRANTTATMIWNGADWTAAGASSSTTLQAAYDNTLTSAGGAELLLSNTANANGLTIRDSTTNSVNGTLLEVQSSTAANLFSVNSNVTDYATDAGAEVAGGTSTTFPASTWTANGSASISRYTALAANVATGVASVSTTTTATAGDGVKNTLSTSLTANNHYNVSFTARLTSGTFTNMDVYYSINGTATSVLCTSNQAVATSVWTKVNCTFTAPSSGITATNAILIRQTTGVVRTFYVDNLSVTIAADFNLATDGTVSDGVNFATNWSTAGLGTVGVTRNTSDGYDASDSAQAAVTAGAANAGVRNKLSINPLSSTLYRISIYAKLNSGAAFTDFKVRYSRDAGTNYVDCTDYNTQTVVTTGWTQITCYLTTDGTAPSSPYVYFTETASAVRTFSVDTFSMTLAQNTTPNVQIGGGLNGGPVTLFTLDRGASAPIAANNDSMLGSMYYDTSLGKLQCYEADGWGACGSSPDNIVTISPEYTNAVLNGTGIGTMTSDFCSDQLNLNDGSSSQPTICGTNETYNFYKWTSPQASAQTYSIYVTYQLPTSFKGFSSGSTSIMGRTDSANSTVRYTVYRNSAAGLSQCGSAVTVSTGSVSTWQPGPATGAADPSTCGFAGGNSIIFKIEVIASVNANAYVGNLGFTYTNQ